MNRLRVLAACALVVGCAPRSESPAVPSDYQPPRLLNEEQVAELLRAQEVDRGARIVLWLYVDTLGIPARIQIRTGAADPALDSAAVRVARIMEFEPARRAGRQTFAWIEQPLVFVPAPARPPPVSGRLAPRLLNDVSIVGTIRSGYRGLSGWAHVWVWVAASGRPDDVRVLSTSDPRLERAAAELVLGFRFEPARFLRAGGLPAEATAASAVVRIDFGPQGSVRTVIPDLDQANASQLRATAPHDVPPRLRDAAAARHMLADAIRTVGGSPSTRALLWLFIDARGEVVVTHLRTPTGDERIDDALIGAVRNLQIVPARRGGQPVGAWLELPVGATSG